MEFIIAISRHALGFAPPILVIVLLVFVFDCQLPLPLGSRPLKLVSLNLDMYAVAFYSAVTTSLQQSSELWYDAIRQKKATRTAVRGNENNLSVVGTYYLAISFGTDCYLSVAISLGTNCYLAAGTLVRRAFHYSSIRFFTYEL